MIKFKSLNDDFSHSYLICRFDTCMIIDPSHSYDAILESLNGRKLAGILLTHAHSDHVHLIGEFDAPIYMHTDDAHLLFEDQYNGYAPKTHPYKRKQLNLKFVKHLDKIPIADQMIEVFHTPGHTKGGISFLFDGRLFTGDTLFKESVGRHDLYSGNLPELKKSVLFLCNLPGNTKVYPGHDQETNIRHEQKNNPFYQKWLKQSK
jgi:hydroxyacylglutathione hydrolase